MRLEINYRKKCKKHKHLEGKQHVTKQIITKEIKEEKRHYLETNEMKTQWSKPMRYRKIVLGGKFIAI